MTTRKSNEDYQTDHSTKIQRIERSTNGNGSSSINRPLPISIYQNDKINKCTDVILVAGNKRIPAHRQMLGAGSEYFATKFASQSKDSVLDEKVMTDVDGDTLMTLVLYCYTGCVELQGANLSTLLKTARRLQFDQVVEACCLLLKEQLNPGNCLGIKKLADAEECTDLSRAARVYASQNFLQVVKREEFLLSTVQEVANFLESKDVIVPSEETIFHALMAWLEHDLENRSKDANFLLNCIKLPLLSPEFIIEHIQSNDIFKNEWIPQDLIKEELTINFLPENFQDVLIAIDRTSINAHFFEDNIWKEVAEMRQDRYLFGAEIIGNKLLIIGGKMPMGGQTNLVKSVESFNFSSRSWDAEQPMKTPRCELGVAVLNDILYAIGGENRSSSLETVEKWDPVSEQWSFVAPMSSRRSGVGVAVINDKLYAVGGSIGRTYLNTMESYDPQTNEWKFCASMSTARSHMGIGVLNDQIYVLGGQTSSGNSNLVERYNPETNTWCTVAGISEARSRIGVAALGDQLFAVGGWNGRKILTLVEAYDPDINEWQKLSPAKIFSEVHCLVIKKSILQT